MNIENKSDMSIAKTKPTKLRDRAFYDIESLILTGALAPGSWVTEASLIKATGHRLAAVRSAMDRLSNEGLINVFQSKGAQIYPVDFPQQFRLLEFRRVVERLIARLAANRATKEQKNELAMIAEEFRSVTKIGDQQIMTELDAKCFALIQQAANNSFASKSLLSIKGLSRRFWILYQEKHGDSHKMAYAHAAIAEAISQGDPELAEIAVNQLIEYIEKFTLKVAGFSLDD